MPCPLGWGSAPADTIRIARLAVESGLFPLFEAEHGEVTARTQMRRRVPVDEYLKLQKRFAHLFGKPPDVATHRARSRRSPTATSRRFGLRDRERSMEKPFAITLDPGSSLANKTGAWRTDRPVYVDRLPPCNHACPAGENIQGWLYHAESGDYEARVAGADRGTIRCPRSWGASAITRAKTRATAARSTRRSASHSVERFLGDEARKHGLEVRDRPPAPSGKRVLVVGAGPSGLSAAYHLRAARPRT